MVQQNSEIATSLLRINAIKISSDDPFTWASGMRSPIYCDNRIALSHPKIRKLIISSLVKASKAYEPFDYVAGVATAGISWGAYLAEALNLPFIYVRSKTKGHGRQNLIEGEIKNGMRVLVIEDLISTGGSSLKAVQAIKDAECAVVGVIAIFQYEFNQAKQAFAEADCPFSTLSNYTELLQVAQDLELISGDERQLLARWRNDPENWWNNLNTKVNH